MGHPALSENGIIEPATGDRRGDFVNWIETTAEEKAKESLHYLLILLSGIYPIGKSLESTKSRTKSLPLRDQALGTTVTTGSSEVGNQM